ncbi:transglutaminase-like cysteine peptidase [Nordella sp. HKS 07]|uniref:transglutaminase-like cysteine peptidase n=1 Tax=Nordella sp. HKS 07 TaxID=2712222 RepID=UPI001FEFD4A5|nr:transglutaminase-like cysteine peptidase [Nordella sp. HKS 07]
MTIFARLGGVALGLACMIQAAYAVDADQVRVDPNKGQFQTVYGKALPPIGYVEMCAREPKECRALGGKAVHLALSPERWNLVYQVNTFVNGKIAPVSDDELYGKPEYWTFPTDAGDCEDYLLLKKRYLEGLGFPSEALLITVVLDEKQQGHAVLTVTTDKGDFVLDNRRNEVLRWNNTGYTYLKRQSPEDPRQWVSLTKKPPAHVGAVAAGAARK